MDVPFWSTLYGFSWGRSFWVPGLPGHFALKKSETRIFVLLLSKQCHDMFDFNTKLNGTKLNGIMIPVSFFVHCSCISMFFFCCNIDPLHRKQTLTLSQCNSRDLTDSPYRNLEKCKKCYRYLLANRHLFLEHSAYITVLNASCLNGCSLRAQCILSLRTPLSPGKR